MQTTQNINIVGFSSLTSPRQLIAELPISERATETVLRCREEVKRILAGDDPRMIVVVGPCSIHHADAGLEYARRLRALAEKVQDQMRLVMRVYFEKPRTTVGWKGLINDPHLDDTFDISSGLQIARTLLLQIAEMGLPAATEFLEPITPQYIADLITAASIGARTTESPTHRQMASGLSMPVGYKNGTEGNLDVAINAMQSSRTPHNFLGIDPDGKTCIVRTRGNPWGHLILRGGRTGPNYMADHVKLAIEQLQAVGLPQRLLVDCSHANSSKDYRRQKECWNDVIRQRLDGNTSIIGLMLESNLEEGAQKLTGDDATLKYGVSITDPCIGWEETEALITTGAAALATQMCAAV